MIPLVSGSSIESIKHFRILSPPSKRKLRNVHLYSRPLKSYSRLRNKGNTPSVQFISLPCSFWGKVGNTCVAFQIHFWCWCPWEILDQPLGNRLMAVSCRILLSYHVRSCTIVILEILERNPNNNCRDPWKRNI